MTCRPLTFKDDRKDCYHFGYCGRGCSKDCDGYKDKNKIIELPCKVGDTVYFISKRYTKCSLYENYSNNCDSGCYEVCEDGFICDSKSTYEIKEVLVDGFEINSLGFKIYLHNGWNVYLPNEYVYFTKEEAEKALQKGCEE